MKKLNHKQKVLLIGVPIILICLFGGLYLFKSIFLSPNIEQSKNTSKSAIELPEVHEDTNFKSKVSIYEELEKKQNDEKRKLEYVSDKDFYGFDPQKDSSQKAKVVEKEITQVEKKEATVTTTKTEQKKQNVSKKVVEKPIVDAPVEDEIQTVQNDPPKVDIETFDAVKAVIYGKHEIQDEGLVRIRTVEPLNYKGKEFPTNTILYGKARYINNRVHITIFKAMSKNVNYAVTLYVLDNDNLPGLFDQDGIEKVKNNEIQSINPPGQYGQYIAEVGRKAVSIGKQIQKNTRCLKKADNYSLFITQNPPQQ